MKDEIELWPEKFDCAKDFFASLLGGAHRAVEFRDEYLKCLTNPSTVLFYNKFTVIGHRPEDKKPGLRIVK